MKRIVLLRVVISLVVFTAGTRECKVLSYCKGYNYLQPKNGEMVYRVSGISILCLTFPCVYITLTILASNFT